jgi:DNA-binding XRE family transcriptional regulator
LKPAKRKKVETAGWRGASADEFLGLTAEESALVAMKLSPADGLKGRRKRLQLTQIDAANRIGKSQSRLAKMESADRSVSIDLLIKALLSLGATPRDVGRTIIGAATPAKPTARKRVVG